MSNNGPEFYGVHTVQPAPIVHGFERKSSLPIPITKPKDCRLSIDPFELDEDDVEIDYELNELEELTERKTKPTEYFLADDPFELDKDDLQEQTEKKTKPTAEQFFSTLLKNSVDGKGDSPVFVGSPIKKKPISLF